MRIKPKIVKKWKILQKTAPFLIIGMAVITAGSFLGVRYFYTDIEKGEKTAGGCFLECRGRDSLEADISTGSQEKQ